MHPSAERVQRALIERGSPSTVTELQVRAATAQQAADALGAEVGRSPRAWCSWQGSSRCWSSPPVPTGWT